MAKRALQNSKTVIDPMFFIPEGVEEVVHGEGSTSANDVEDDDLGSSGSEEYGEDDSEYAGDTVDYSEAPETPQIIGVITPQVIRATDTGAEVVDVILEIDDVVADDYEFRVTKI